MGRQVFVSFAILGLVACSNPEPPQEQQATASLALQCGKDTDCKGDRICNAGRCAAADAASVLTAKNPTKKEVAQFVQAEQAPSSDPVPICNADDSRTQIAVWEPSLDEDGLLTSDPPQNDGQLVFIQLATDREDVLTTCNDVELNSFSQTPAGSDSGGLSVNIRGNTQFSQGTCYIKGYFMNDEVLGMHGGWTETYFKALTKEEIVMSSKYCLAKEIDQQV